MQQSIVTGPCARWGRAGLLGDPAVSAVAAIRESPAQVLIRWSIQRQCGDPRATDGHTLAENIDVFDFALTDAGMDTLNAGLDDGTQFLPQIRDYAGG